MTEKCFIDVLLHYFCFFWCTVMNSAVKLYSNKYSKTVKTSFDWSINWGLYFLHNVFHVYVVDPEKNCNLVIASHLTAHGWWEGLPRGEKSTSKST